MMNDRFCRDCKFSKIRQEYHDRSGKTTYRRLDHTQIECNAPQNRLDKFNPANLVIPGSAKVEYKEIFSVKQRGYPFIKSILKCRCGRFGRWFVFDGQKIVQRLEMEEDEDR